MLLLEPVLAHPDWDLPFFKNALRMHLIMLLEFVLCQVIDGRERIIGYYLRLLRDAEKRYNTTQKECLAVVWAVKKLRPYLYGRPFIVKTDHASLKWLLNPRYAFLYGLWTCPAVLPGDLWMYSRRSDG